MVVIQSERTHLKKDLQTMQYNNIENGLRGRDEIVALAQRLSRLDIRLKAPTA